MKTRTLAAAAALMLFAAPAYAFYCPKTVKAIDAALAKATLSAAQTAQVKKSRGGGKRARLHDRLPIEMERIRGPIRPLTNINTAGRVYSPGAGPTASRRTPHGPDRLSRSPRAMNAAWGAFTMN